MDRFDDLLAEDTDKLFDDLLLGEEPDFQIPKGWTTLTMAIPRDFLPIFQETLNAYKTLRESDKDFPAFEAMILEAKNSLESF